MGSIYSRTANTLMMLILGESIFAPISSEIESRFHKKDHYTIEHVVHTTSDIYAATTHANIYDKTYTHNMQFSQSQIKELADIVSMHENPSRLFTQKHPTGFNYISALTMIESTGNVRAKSYANARGLMQLQDAAWEDVNDSPYLENVYNPLENMTSGVRYLSLLEDIARKHPRWDALSIRDKHALIGVGYNWGLQYLKRMVNKDQTISDINIPLETKNHIIKINNLLYNEHKELFKVKERPYFIDSNSAEHMMMPDSTFIMANTDTLALPLNISSNIDSSANNANLMPEEIPLQEYKE